MSKKAFVEGLIEVQLRSVARFVHMFIWEHDLGASTGDYLKRTRK
jgi:hypothetical protein